MKKYLVLLLSFLIFGCDDQKVENTFDQSVYLKNTSDQLIIPSYKEFNTASNAFLKSVEVFQADINNDNLKSVQDTWKVVALAWARAEFVNVGPVKDSFIRQAINYWPINDTLLIHEAIEEINLDENASSQELLSYMQSIGNNRKGIHVAEVLLFSGSNDELLLEYKSNTHKRVFLKGLAVSILDYSDILYQTWTTSYQEEFVDNIGVGVEASFNIIANNILLSIENIKINKLGTPLGKNSTHDGLYPNQLEARYAKFSKELIIENLLMTKAYFLGGEYIGFDDYLNNIEAQYEGQLLSKKIINQIDLIISHLKGLDDSVFYYIENKSTSELNKIYEELRTLEILLKADMASSLNLIVTPSDNDGD